MEQQQSESRQNPHPTRNSTAQEEEEEDDPFYSGWAANDLYLTQPNTNKPLTDDELREDAAIPIPVGLWDLN